MVTTFLLLLFVAMTMYHFVTKNTRRGRLLRKIPGSTPYPIVGNIFEYITNCMHQLWVIARQLMRDYYPITRSWFLHTALIHVAHPADVEILLTSQKAIDKGFVYDFLQPWLKTGLLTSTDEKWRERRKILTPAFHFNILKKYVQITSEQGEKFIEALKNDSQKTVESLIPFCSNVTLNIICESSMGVVLDQMDQKRVTKYKQAIHNMGKIVTFKLLRPFVSDLILLFKPLGKLNKESLEILHDFTSEVLRKRKEYHANTGNKYLNEYTEDLEDTVFNDIDMGRKKRLAMLDLLLAADKSGMIDNEGIKEEVDTFIFEGHDTTSMAMTYTIMLFAENKEAQDTARDEICAVLDRSNGKIGTAEIQELNYLERCIKESLRLYPPVATIMRYTSEELQLKHALIPADTHLLIHFWDTHRDPDFWPDPEKFDPDRFLPEYTKNRHPFAYVPFSAGPRNCIGQKFAMMELKSLMARILYDFYLEPIDRIDDIKFIADLMLRPLNPVRTKFVKINK